MKRSWKTKPSNAERVQSLISQTHNVDRKGPFGFPTCESLPRVKQSMRRVQFRWQAKQAEGVVWNLKSVHLFCFLSITCHWKKGFFYASQINFRGCWLVKMQDLLEWLYWNACQWGQDFWMSSFHTSFQQCHESPLCP